MELREGATYTHARTFTPEDVRQFGDVTGDTQPIHTDPDEDGRLVVQGLLTGSLLTKIGGDLEVLATGMDLAFHRKVYTGERVVCEWTNDRVDERGDRYALDATVVCTVDGEVVLEADVEGVVWKE